jgi:hypothetical protein
MLQDNQLTSLHEAVGQLSGLKHLDLRGNPIPEDPDPTTKEVLAVLRQRGCRIAR